MLDSLGALCWSTELYELWLLRPRFVTCLASPGVDANWQDALGAASSRSLRFWAARRWRSSDASQHSVSHDGKYRQTSVLCTSLYMHAPSWMPLLDFCRCLQHLTVPLRVWGPAQTAAASTSDASTSTSYGRLGPYRQSTCDILRPFVTFCDHLWPLRKKRWLFSDYLVNLVTIYDYLVNLVTTLRFIMFHMFHAIDDQSASDIFGQCQGHQQQKVNPMSLPPSDCCICCAG